jgi:hypothetical protein
MTNGRGPPCDGGIGGLMGIGPGRGTPWVGGEPCGLLDPEDGVHLVGRGGIDLTPVDSDGWPIGGRSVGVAHFDGTGDDCEL